VTTSDGVEIAVHDLGGAGEPLLLVHGTGFHAMTWLPVAQYLRDHFTCWAVDLRGHGDSERPPGISDWLGFGRDVLAAVDGLELQGAFGVGHSMGSASLLLAEQAVPGTFRSLYLYEPAMADPRVNMGDGSKMAAEGALRRREVFASREAARLHYASKAPMDTFAPESLAAYVNYGFADLDDGTVRLKCRATTESEVFHGFPNPHVYEHLGHVHCPVTLVDGELSVAARVSRGNDFAARIPDARVIALPGLDHFGPMQRPDVLAASIIETFTGSRPAIDVGDDQPAGRECA